MNAVPAFRPPLRLKLNTPPQPLGSRRAARAWSGWLSSSGRDRLDQRMLDQMGHQLARVVHVTVHAQPQGFHALQDLEGVHGRQASTEVTQAFAAGPQQEGGDG